jgi:hypothetical protein
MKIVTMCQGGNVRSVGLGYVLKYHYGQDVLACSWEKNTDETRRMLYAWGDRIIVMEADFVKYVPPEFQSKVVVYDVGPNRWGSSLHPELLDIVDKLIREDPAWSVQI